MKHESRVNFGSSVINGKLFPSCFALPRAELSEKCHKYIRDFATEDCLQPHQQRDFFPAHKGRLNLTAEKGRKRQKSTADELQ